MRCAITGATGYVGSAIARYFLAQGWEVLSLGRRALPGTTHVPWDLTGDPGTIPWSSIDALVHCAHHFQCRDWKEMRRMNVEGSERLLQTASSHGIRDGVFISSVSAFEGCQSLYGRAKLLVEMTALQLGFSVVRPGLVHGNKPGGMMAALERAASAGPLLPMLGDGSYPQYLVHDEDLSRLIFLLCQKIPASQRSRPLTAASAEAVPLADIVRMLAARKGRAVRFVPVPWRLVLAGLKLAEALHVPVPFRSDSLIGIIRQNPAPDFSQPEGLRVSFRPFAP